MQKFHLVPRCLYLSQREAAVVEGLRRGGERLPRARVLLVRPGPGEMDAFGAAAEARDD